MSKAIKCDRCETCFDPEGMGEKEYMWFSNPHFLSGTSYRERQRTRLLRKNRASDDPIDLCPHCTRAFEQFMNMD